MSSMSDLAIVFADVDPYPARHAGPNPVILERRDGEHHVFRYFADDTMVHTSRLDLVCVAEPTRILVWAGMLLEDDGEQAEDLAALNAPGGAS